MGRSKGGRRASGMAAATLGTMLLAAPPAARGAERLIVERFEAAARLRWPQTMAAMKNATPVPHWIGDTDRFWYRRETATGSEFVVVDAATGAKSPAFDAKAVAASLSGLLKAPVAADALPFSAIDLAPDGGVAFDARGERFACTGGACTKQGVVSTPDLVVSPDKRSAVTSRDGNLWLRDLASGQEKALTAGGTAETGFGVQPSLSDFRALARAGGAKSPPFWTVWSPDSRRVITARVDVSKVAPYPYIDYAPADGSFRPKAGSVRLALVGEPLATVELHAIDVASGRSVRLDLPYDRLEMRDVGIKRLVWSRDAKRLYLFVTAADQTSASLFDIDTTTGRIREVIREQGRYPALLAAGGYDSPATAVLEARREVVWFSQRDGWPHLYLYDLGTGRLKHRITAGAWSVRSVIKIDEKAGRIAFVANGREGGDPYHRSLYSIALDGRGLKRLTPEADDKPMVAPDGKPGFDGAPAYQPLSPDGRYVAYVVAPLAKPAVAVVRRTDGMGAPATYETADASALFAAGFRPPEPFTAKAADGASDIWGVIYRPSDYDPARRYPVLDAQYNSPLVTIVPHSLASASTNVIEAAPPASDAELGFIVVMMDARGTPYRGEAFSTPGPDYLAHMGLADHVAVIRSLAARDPSMDLERVGITGASFGGWTTIRALIDFNDLYKVGVAWAPPGAFYNMYNGAGLTMASGPALYAGGATLRPGPTDKPVSWTAMDSIAQVGRLKGRLMIGSGALDENVLPGSTLQFVDAAARADKNVEPLFLPETNHGPVAYFDYVQRRIWEFLTLNLRGERPPPGYTLPKTVMPGAR